MEASDRDLKLEAHAVMDQPSPARMYDYFLGGSHNFPIDRQVAEHVLTIYPDAALNARVNRAFLRRAVRFLVGQGIDQFLDIGSGIPTVGNVHEVAQQGNPGARVVYVDCDPIAVHHSIGTLKDIPTATAIQADARQPEDILTHLEVRRLLDFGRPIAVLLLAVLPFITDDVEARSAVNSLREVLASGSYIAIAHGTYEGAPRDVLEQAERLYAGTTNPAKGRSRSEILSFFNGLDLIEPGLVYAPLWRPESPQDLFLDQPERSILLVGIGYKRRNAISHS